MSRIFTFVFILFATLSIVNAAPYHLDKRAAQFQLCPGLPPDVVPLDVKMSPDPIVAGKTVTFDVSGTLKHDIKAEDKPFLVIVLIDPSVGQPIGDPLVLDICSDAKVKCPITAGTPYTTTQTITAAKELPPDYLIGVGIAAGDPPNIVPYACEQAEVGGTVGASPYDFTSVIF